MMDTLNTLLTPTWGAETWIQEGWNELKSDEKADITQRMDGLFANGLPFELKHDKTLYIYAFSLLAQLEVLAIQVPLKFEACMPTSEFKARMRAQLVDEVFHGMVFTRILYELITPYGQPPAYNKEFEVLCDFIRHEDSPQVAVVLLNLIAEGWIEELFRAFCHADIAPTVFNLILEDEHRHVCEADLYRSIGVPASEILEPKVAFLEEQLLVKIFFQYPYMISINTLLGYDVTQAFGYKLHEKHTEQLQKLNLKPGKLWAFWGSSMMPLSELMKEHTDNCHQLEMSAARKFFMTQWGKPSDPTMVGEFDLDISRYGFFSKKHPSEMLTLLMLQAISQGVSEKPEYRRFLSHGHLYQSDKAYVAVIVKLPSCDEHLGGIVFENCHLWSAKHLSIRLRQALEGMVYCYKRRVALEAEHPHLARMMNQALQEMENGAYPYPIPGNSIVSVSNIGHTGFKRGKSPLRINEAIKFTLFEVERKPVWNDEMQSFEPQDSLPVSISADHRILDGNSTFPKHLPIYFNHVLDRISSDTPGDAPAAFNIKEVNDLLEMIIDAQLELGYKLLVMLQTLWFDPIKLEDWVNVTSKLVESAVEA
jgi:hypothetical protein